MVFTRLFLSENGRVVTIGVRPEWIRSEYVFDPSGFDPKYLFISVFAKKYSNLIVTVIDYSKNYQ